MVDEDKSQRIHHGSIQMQRLITYFSLLDGKHAWDEVRVAAEDLSHPNFTITTKTLTLDRSGWLTFMEHFVAAGGKVDMKLFMYSSPEKIRCEIDVFSKDGSIVHLSSLGTFRDGKLFHDQPFSPDSYDMVFMSGTVKQNDTGDIKEEVRNEGLTISEAVEKEDVENDLKKVIHKSSSFFLRERFKIKDKKIMPLYW